MTRRLAWANAIVHVIGLGFAVTVMRGPYLEFRPDEAGLAWKVAWLCWIVAGGVFVWFIARLARHEPGHVGLVAVILAPAAFLIDLYADIAWIAYPETPEARRWLYVLGAVIANSLYSAAVLFVGMRRMRLTLAVFSCGVAFTLAAAFSWDFGAMAFSGLTILLFSAWGLLMAYTVPGPESGAGETA